MLVRMGGVALMLTLLVNDELSIRSKVIDAPESRTTLTEVIATGTIRAIMNSFMDVLNMSFEARVAT